MADHFTEDDQPGGASDCQDSGRITNIKVPLSEKVVAKGELDTKSLASVILDSSV